VAAPAWAAKRAIFFDSSPTRSSSSATRAIGARGAQVAGHRLLQRDERQRVAIQPRLVVVDQGFARENELGQAQVAIEQRPDRAAHLVDHEATHLDGVRAQVRQRVVDRLRRVALERIAARVRCCGIRRHDWRRAARRRGDLLVRFHGASVSRSGR
jgi:hypothetical protein